MIVFLLEDDTDDQTLFKEALSEIDPSIILTIAPNGQEAIDSLNRGPQRPDLIFADINVPLLNGIEFLQLIKQTHHLLDIPVIMLSTSRREAYDKEINALGARFFTKPDGFRELCNIIQQGLGLVTS